MFNMLGEDPPIVMISINRLQDGELKDTAANILANGEFVVHIADEAMAEQMHRCGETLPAARSELEAVGLTAAPRSAVAAAHRRGARRLRMHAVGDSWRPPAATIFIGSVLWLHARDDLIDIERWRVRLQDYFPVARFGASYYMRTRDRFSMEAASATGPIRILT